MHVNDINRMVTEEGEDFNIRFDPSPNINPNVQLPQRTLVIHAPSNASVAGAVGTLKQKPPKNSFLLRSTHLILGRDGREIAQMIPFQLGANHASGFNNRSIAIDLVYPGELVEKGFSFQLKSNFSIDQYILASGLSSSRYGYWPLYPKEQLDALLVIAKALKNKYDIVDAVAHDEILTAIHPGPAFPIAQFREKFLGITERSFLLQETSRSVLLFGVPEEPESLLLKTRIPKGTPVAIINEKDDSYLISVMAEVNGNPWLMGWVQKSAVQVRTDFVSVVRPDHYLTTAEGRRFQEIEPHPNGYEHNKFDPNPKYIIMHFTTGTKMESTINHFKDPTSLVSTHLLIGRDGRVVQFLPFDRIAHHTGYSWWEQESNLNKCSIGIELDNAGLLIRKDNVWQRNKIIVPDSEVLQEPHWKQYTPNDPKKYPGWQTFTKVQLDVALNIVKALVKRYPSIQEILGHDDVNLRNRYDPGPAFPMRDFRMALFGRETPNIKEYVLNHETDIWSNFNGRLPNTNQRTFDLPLPANSLVSVIREEGDFTLVSILKAKDSKIQGSGWIQTTSLEKSSGSGVKQGKKKIAKKAVDKRRTLISQAFFKRGENTPTPKLADKPFVMGTRVRLQEIRSEWTLVVLLDKINGRAGWEGWMPSEFLTPKGEFVMPPPADVATLGIPKSVVMGQLWQHKDDNGALKGPRPCSPCPAVFTFHTSRVQITKQWQFFIRAINYNMSVGHVYALFDPTKAFCNRPPNNRRANYLENENLDRPDPEFDKVRTCALSVLTGRVNGSDLIVTMMNGSEPPPLKEGCTYPERVEDINRDDYLFTPWTHRHLFFAANIIRPNGKTIPFAHGAVYDWTNDGLMYTWLPHVKLAKFEVRYPLANLMQLPAGAPIPIPYKM